MRTGPETKGYASGPESEKLPDQLVIADEAGCPFKNGFNVGGTAEVFSSLNVLLRDFLVFKPDFEVGLINEVQDALRAKSI
ncbi:hypothetical protein [Desulfosporosinus youngiae]|uniref:Uncharacterized protein n=1 Tax=Desulfosporosinus youngiae DSM 17734 TaxID=768710 RepID=H5Y102_9FIRM|nr:hypothetical protein [Desulfosporosinus youngiae]EHQ87370.1 hypothetical protein DesyoDRAFT_0169 [Desulfosporosinus youngiae DSM 17734]